MFLSLEMTLAVCCMEMRNLMTCVRKQMIVLSFYVYATFYSHLFIIVTQQMVTHQNNTQNCNKKWAIAFGKCHLGHLLESSAVTFLMNTNYLRILHQIEVVFQGE